MRNIQLIFKPFMILSIVIFSSLLLADGGIGKIFKDWYENKKAGVSSVQFQQYNDICGSCHFPYQPGLLPAVSWEKLMSNIDNHFGKNVELSPVDKRTMTRYLLDNSAGHGNDEISYNILQSLKYEPLIIRITNTPYFVETHKSLDYKDKKLDIGECDSCHQNATQGMY